MTPPMIAPGTVSAMPIAAPPTMPISAPNQAPAPAPAAAAAPRVTRLSVLLLLKFAFTLRAFYLSHALSFRVAVYSSNENKLSEGGGEGVWTA
jgi:hypothetical protein